MMKFFYENKAAYKITLVYSNSDLKRAAYLSELEDLLTQNSAMKLIKIFGPLEAKDMIRLIDQNPLWYIAGPSGMVKTARHILMDADIIDRDIKTEEFTGY